MGAALQNDGRDVSPPAGGRGLAVFQGLCRPEARADFVAASPDAADQEDVVFLHAALQQAQGVIPAFLRRVEVFVQLSCSYSLKAYPRLPADHSLDVLVHDVVVHVYRDGELVHLLVRRERGREEFLLSLVF